MFGLRIWGDDDDDDDAASAVPCPPCESSFIPWRGLGYGKASPLKRRPLGGLCRVSVVGVLWFSTSSGT